MNIRLLGLLIFCYLLLWQPVTAQTPTLDWVNQYEGTGTSTLFPHCLETTPTGQSLVAGNFSGTIDFDPGVGTFFLTNQGFSDLYLQKLNGAGQLLWAKTISSPLNVTPQELVFDTQDNIFIVGHFSDTADFDPGPGSFILGNPLNGDLNVFVVKLDSTGNFIWAKDFSGQSNDFSRAIAVDGAGNSYAGGHFRDSIDLDPGPAVLQAVDTGNVDGFFVKLDTNGDLIWAKVIEATGESVVQAIEVDAFGNTYVTGAFQDTADLDPGPGVQTAISAGNTDLFLLKLDPAGDLIWAKTAGGPDIDFVFELKLHGDACLHMTGYFSDSCDLDFSSNQQLFSSNGFTDNFIQKLDTAGQPIWIKTWGSADFDETTDLALDSCGNVYATGRYFDTVDVDPGPDTTWLNFAGANNTFGDIFVTRLDPQGTFDEAYSISAFGPLYAGQIATYPNGKFTVSGAFESPVDLDPGTGTTLFTPQGQQDAFIQTMTGPAQACLPMQCVVVSACSSYTTSSNNTTLTSSGLYLDTLVDGNGVDSLVVMIQLTLQQSFDTLNIDTCADSLVSPSGLYTWDIIGTYQDTQTNAAGCDSILTINLTFTNIDSNLTVSACDSLIAPNGIETWFSSGIFSDTLFGAAGCDTVITVDLTVDSSTFSSQSAFTCDTSYAWLGNNYTADGTYMDTLTNIAGCDSVMTLQLSFGTPSSSSQSVAICSPSYDWQGNTYTNSGTYFDTIPNSQGCDSILTLHLALNSISTSTETISTCDSAYTWQGTTYSTSGTYQALLVNSVGCDSILTLNLTLQASSGSSESVTTCENSYEWQGNTYTFSGTYSDTLTNAAGCDSILTLNLTFASITVTTTFATTCDSLVSPSGRFVWYETGVYRDTLTNAQGCDSIITMNLNVNRGPTTRLVETSCNAVLSPSGNHLWTASGFYADTLTRANGCDSIFEVQVIIPQLAIDVVKDSNRLVAVDSTGSLQWLDCETNLPVDSATSRVFEPEERGLFALIVSSGDCVDTSACFWAGPDEPSTNCTGGVISIYPNPMRGNFAVEFQDTQRDIHVRIFDAQGKEVLNQSYPDAPRVKSNIRGAAGFYLIEVQTETIYEVCKLVKQ